MTSSDSRASTRVYLDVCALCRPLDDQKQARIRLETDAVLLIFENIRRGVLQMTVSSAHRLEIQATARKQEASQVLMFLEQFGVIPSYNFVEGRSRAEFLCRSRLGVADAAHIAFAEQAADVFITCDDAMIRKCRAIAMRIPIMGPAAFCVQENLK